MLSSFTKRFGCQPPLCPGTPEALREMLKLEVFVEIPGIIVWYGSVQYQCSAKFFKKYFNDRIEGMQTFMLLWHVLQHFDLPSEILYLNICCY